MKSTERKAQFGKVSEGDRDCFRRLGRANAAATRMEKPAGTLAEAIERMARIEGSRGIDVVATAQDHWPDYASHMNYIAAVRRMAAKERAGRRGACAADG